MLPANHDLRVVDDVHHEHQRANAAIYNLEDLRGGGELLLLVVDTHGLTIRYMSSKGLRMSGYIRVVRRMHDTSSHV